MGSFFAFGQIAFMVIFCLTFVVILVVIIAGLRQWNRNNHAPRLTVEALVVSRRLSVHHHHAGASSAGMHTHTSYYVTFQVNSGDRLELPVSGVEYGQLAEGDRGLLTFQGTRYLRFERTMC